MLPKEAEALLAVSPGDFVEERKRIARSLRDDAAHPDWPKRHDEYGSQTGLR